MTIRILKGGVAVLLGRDGQPVAKMKNLRQNRPVLRVRYTDPGTNKDVSLLFPLKIDNLALEIVPLSDDDRLEVEVSQEYQEELDEMQMGYQSRFRQLSDWCDKGIPVFRKDAEEVGKEE